MNFTLYPDTCTDRGKSSSTEPAQIPQALQQFSL